MPLTNRKDRLEYAKQYYRKNKKQQQALAGKSRKRKLAKLAHLKAKAGCVVCGESDPRCLEFHHRDPEQKSFGIGGGNRSWKSTKEEMSKCNVMCANCHRKLERTDLRLFEEDKAWL